MLTTAFPTSMYVHTKDELGDPVTVTRPHTCSCGKEFTQNQVSRKWLVGMETSRAVLFAENLCDIEPDKTIWTPKQCTQCDRQTLNRRA